MQFLFKEPYSSQFIKRLGQGCELILIYLSVHLTFVMAHVLTGLFKKSKYYFTLHIPFTIIVHSINSVPFCIQLSKCIPDLNGFRSRSFEDHIWLLFMNDCNLLPEFVQLIFDILQMHCHTLTQSSKEIRRMKSRKTKNLFCITLILNIMRYNNCCSAKLKTLKNI